MNQRHLCGITTLIVMMMLVLVTSPARLHARGERIPLPPAYSGGGIGSWLGSGPIFGFEDPIGPGFGPRDPGTGGGGSGGGFTWDPIDGGTGGAHGSGSGGCPGECLSPSWTGPCKYLCECYYENPDGGEDIRPKSGDEVTGRCVWTGQGDNLGACVDENNVCSYRIP